MSEHEYEEEGARTLFESFVSEQQHPQKKEEAEKLLKQLAQLARTSGLKVSDDREEGLYTWTISRDTSPTYYCAIWFDDAGNIKCYGCTNGLNSIPERTIDLKYSISKKAFEGPHEISNLIHHKVRPALEVLAENVIDILMQLDGQPAA